MLLRSFFTLPVALLLCLTASLVQAQEAVVVIVNADNPEQSLSSREINRIYRNHTLRWDNGGSIILYDLMDADPVRERFSQAILGRSASKVAERWAHMKITNQAKNPPNTMKSQRLIIKRVAKQKGAIGYVSISAFKLESDPRVRQVFLVK